MIFPFDGKKPQIHASAFVAPGSHLIGDVRLAKDASIWFGAVLRGDLASIKVGQGTNIQDNAVVHVDRGQHTVIGKGVIVGHQATIHACTIEDGVLVGIGSRILSGARIGKFSLIGAGAVVLENAVIPPYSMVLGIPGKVFRKLTAEEAATHLPWAQRYVALSKKYKKVLG